MNLQNLQRTARNLRQPEPVAAAEFETLRDGLAEELNQRRKTRPDFEKLIGPGNLPMMQDNSRNFCRFMSSLFTAYEPEVLVQTALWVFRAYRAHGFPTTYWPANRDTFVKISDGQLEDGPGPTPNHGHLGGRELVIVAALIPILGVDHAIP